MRVLRGEWAALVRIAPQKSHGQAYFTGNSIPLPPIAADVYYEKPRYGLAGKLAENIVEHTKQCCVGLAANLQPGRHYFRAQVPGGHYFHIPPGFGPPAWACYLDEFEIGRFG